MDDTTLDNIAYENGFVDPLVDSRGQDDPFVNS